MRDQRASEVYMWTACGTNEAITRCYVMCWYVKHCI